jgi:proline iminopeptidase
MPICSACALQGPGIPVEHLVPVSGASLYARTVGTGRPTIVLHGGPDFDHSYLLPDLDHLSDSFRLVYYDQRGRGRSAEGVRPEDVTLASDIEDVDAVRQHFGLEAPVLLGHSWGAVLALEYVLLHPERVSALILMNPAPAATSDVTLLQTTYRQALGDDMDRQVEIVASAAYQDGEPEAVAARYRIHFMHALARPQDYERLMSIMRSAFIRQGSAGILKARAVEDQLMRDTWQLAAYDLLPQLRNLGIPTLVITGADDFIPVAVSEHIAAAIPSARLVTISNCGHFTYLECTDDVRDALTDFFTAR